MAKKVKVDLEKYLESKGYIYNLSQKSVTTIDFSCIFEKDLTRVQKQKLKKMFGDNPDKIIEMFLAVRGFSRDFGATLRKDIKITHNNKRGTWSATVIKKK